MAPKRKRARSDSTARSESAGGDDDVPRPTQKKPTSKSRSKAQEGSASRSRSRSQQQRGKSPSANGGDLEPGNGAAPTPQKALGIPSIDRLVDIKVEVSAVNTVDGREMPAKSYRAEPVASKLNDGRTVMSFKGTYVDTSLAMPDGSVVKTNGYISALLALQSE